MKKSQGIFNNKINIEKKMMCYDKYYKIISWNKNAQMITIRVTEVCFKALEKFYSITKKKNEQKVHISIKKS